MLPIGYGVPRVLTVTPVITAGAYLKGDAVGGKLTFFNAGNAPSGGWGFITGFHILDKGQIKGKLDLVLFNADFTAVADNEVFDVSDADLSRNFAVLSTGTYVDFGLSNSMYALHFGLNGSPMYRCMGGKHLYGQLRAADPITFTATDQIAVRLSLVQMG